MSNEEGDDSMSAHEKEELRAYSERQKEKLNDMIIEKIYLLENRLSSAPNVVPVDHDFKRQVFECLLIILKKLEKLK